MMPGLKKPMGHNAVVTFHTGAAETVGTVRLLEKPELAPGETSWAQIKLAAPVALAKGDFFVVRSSLETLGGGVIVDPHPKRHRRFRASVLASLSTLERGTPEEILLQSLEMSEPIDLMTLLDKSGLARDEARSAFGRLLANEQAIALGTNGQEIDRLPAQIHVFSSSGWGTLAEKVRTALETYHTNLPLRIGMPKEELKSRLRLAPRLFSEVMDRLTKEGRVVEESNAYRLPSHVRRLSAAQQAEAERYLQAISSNPFAPPSDLVIDAEVLGFLADKKKVVKVTESVVFSATAYGEMRQRIIDQTRQKGTITVAEVRDMFGTSRKYALAFLEHLDEQRVTRRVGDERVLR
jgi:selenocysteine-specific elongation factor